MPAILAERSQNNQCFQKVREIEDATSRPIEIFRHALAELLSSIAMKGRHQLLPLATIEPALLRSLRRLCRGQQ
jgi:hypothetical protein